MAQGHDAVSLAAIPLEVKRRLIRLHAEHRIGWRAEALNAFNVCAFLNGVENAVRTLVQQRSKSRVPKAPMPSFEKLFGLPEPARTFEDFTDWIDGLEDAAEA